jgi:hypothetical protein
MLRAGIEGWFGVSLMSSLGFFYPDVVARMTAVYKSAVKELKLESAPAIEHERLATCILSLGHSHSDQHRLFGQIGAPLCSWTFLSASSAVIG